jgi:Ca-activated chloride channel family protein
MEFVGYNLIRTSVFPVAPKGTQKVRLTYEQLLTADGPRIDYVIPRSESLEYNVPWDISVKIKSKKPVSTVYSPSHELLTTRSGANAVSVKITAKAGQEPGPFLLSYLVENKGVTASLFTYPDPKAGGGYFLLLAGLPARISKDAKEKAIKREVTLVLDRSGSMNGEKIEQAREAALQVLAGLEDDETFNIITYSDTVDYFSKTPVINTGENAKRARAYIKRIKAGGGTNIYDALTEVLVQKPLNGKLPVVLFLTDGLPTVGQTSEVAIRNLAIKANPHKKRIFTFGVGYDVNSPLLDRLASETRAVATYVLPEEDVEVKVAQVFKRLSGPVLADTALDICGPGGKPAEDRVSEIMPAKLPDLFEGDQLVLIGRYFGAEPITFSLSGNYLGEKRAFKFTFGLDKATTRNSFVPRLWASRRIGMLSDAIRQLGADAAPAAATAITKTDPKIKELVDEIVRLSMQYGVLTEYTAFFAREGTDLSKKDAVLAEANKNFNKRSINGQRWGRGSMNQSYNGVFQKGQRRLNYDNKFYDENMNRVSVTSIQQVNDMAFYKRGTRWVDSRLVEKEKDVKPTVIEFGGEEFMKLARRLAARGQQGAISLSGEILIMVDGESILIKAPEKK